MKERITPDMQFDDSACFSCLAETRLTAYYFGKASARENWINSKQTARAKRMYLVEPRVPDTGTSCVILVKACRILHACVEVPGIIHTTVLRGAGTNRVPHNTYVPGNIYDEKVKFWP